jgi:murein DD-endopeptidase MepM/ murein hydrolase activator NlpD
MLRAAPAHAPIDVISRVLIAVLATLLLLSVEGVVSRPAEAGGNRDVVTTIRQRQLRAESAMRRAEQQLRRLQRQRSAHAKRLHQARQQLQHAVSHRDRARRQALQLRKELTTERAVRDRKLRVHPNPAGFQLADRPKLRRRVSRLKARVEQLERGTARLTSQVQGARRQKQALARRVGQGRIEARKSARERAESVLGDQIVRMLALSKERAAVDMAATSPRSFKRPAKGRISQGYGCQQVKRGKRGAGTCVRFHDGVDIATARGAKVRASADGYVAYVGFNPWDRGRRAFVVIIGHARGIETIYGHLAPIRRVKAGQRVTRGQVIGVVGMTGHTSGPHVHWEVSRDFRTMNPLRAGR